MKNNNSVRNFKIELDDFRNHGKEKKKKKKKKRKKKDNEEDIFGNYRMNYLTELDLNIDVVLIVYIFYAKILLF